MEDVIPESESLMFPLDPSPRDGAKAEDGHEAKVGEGRANGFNNNLNLLPILTSGGEDGDKEVDKEQRSIGNDEGKDEETGGGLGGLITNLISNLVSPRSSTPKAAGEGITKRKVEDEGDEIVYGGCCKTTEQDDHVGCGSENGGGGGVFSNLISNIFHQSNGDGENEEGKEAEKGLKDVGNKRLKTEDEEGGGGGGGGGIIDNLVSHLPTSIPDDAVPTTDEASILIHSVRD